MKKQAFNPYLPSWEYVPDGEPHVFGDRVYVYGSHDLFNGYVFCMGDYVCWSAPINNLGDWRYEGVIYARDADPLNAEGKMCIYAPDVTQGPDGRYYLYYVLDKARVVSVAVCDTPAGAYTFYGYVHYADGTRLGDRAGDEPQFDPAVFTEGIRTYLYTGFCPRGGKDRHGAMATVLGPDMLKIEEAPQFVIPGIEYADGTAFEGHAFFEAASIRKYGDMYYLVYSSTAMHELCYATSKAPTEGFRYGGVVVSNCDLFPAQPEGKPKAYGGNNHGGMVQMNGQWYIFYHRQTNGTWYSRQGCAEAIELLPDGSISQVEITSCGLNGGPLHGKGEYPAYIACNLFGNESYVLSDSRDLPRVTQDGRDGDEEAGYIAGIVDGTTVGFKYFDFQRTRRLSIQTRGYAKGVFHIRTARDGAVLASIPIQYSNVWEVNEAGLEMPDGKHALYLTYSGEGNAMLKSISLA